MGTHVKERPDIVCLCGSTKFKQEFIKANFEFTMKGYIVLTVGWFSHADGKTYTPTKREKQKLDELHCAKIDLADEVYILNIDNYIGESTAREIYHAVYTGKEIYYKEEMPIENIQKIVNGVRLSYSKYFNKIECEQHRFDASGICNACGCFDVERFEEGVSI